MDWRVRIIKCRQKKRTGVQNSTKTTAAKAFAGTFGVRAIIVMSNMLRNKKPKEKNNIVCTFIRDRTDGALSSRTDRRIRAMTCVSPTRREV